MTESEIKEKANHISIESMIKVRFLKGILRLEKVSDISFQIFENWNFF